MANSLLTGLRALDLTDQKGLVCGQILGSMGIDVIKIEKPGGDAARNIPPFVDHVPNPDRSLYWFSYNTDKRGITLDLQTSRGQELFKQLVATADFVLESYKPGYLDNLGLGYQNLSLINKGIIVTSITDFGQKGPYSQFKSCELVNAAMSGILDNTGQADRPGVKEPFESLAYHACGSAALGTLMALFARQANGGGQHVDVSIQEVATTRCPLILMPWIFDQRVVKRAGVYTRVGMRPFQWIWPCQDGYVFWWFMGGPMGAPANEVMRAWMAELGVEHPLRDVSDFRQLDMHSLTDDQLAVLHDAIAEFFGKLTKKTIAEEGLKRRLNAVVVNNPVDVLNSRHLAARGFWIQLDHLSLGRSLTYPKYFVQTSGTENYTTRRAPMIGEHNKEIFEKELGLSNTETASLRAAGII